MNNLYKSIGQKIRKIRKMKEMTLEDLSFETNIDWSFLARIETGKAVPSLATLYKISVSLNISMNQLFSNKDDLKKEDLLDKDIYSILIKLSTKDKQRIFEIIKLILQ